MSRLERGYWLVVLLAVGAILIASWLQVIDPPPQLSAAPPVGAIGALTP